MSIAPPPVSDSKKRPRWLWLSIGRSESRKAMLRKMIPVPTNSISQRPKVTLIPRMVRTKNAIATGSESGPPASAPHIGAPLITSATVRMTPADHAARRR
jgi:hypothetical protein